MKKLTLFSFIIFISSFANWPIGSSKLSKLYKAIAAEGKKQQKGCQASLLNPAIVSQALGKNKISEKDYEKYKQSAAGKKAMASFLSKCVRDASKKWRMKVKTRAGKLTFASAQADSEKKSRGFRPTLGVYCQEAQLVAMIKTGQSLEYNMANNLATVELTFANDGKARQLQFQVSRNGKDLLTANEKATKSFLEKVKTNKKLSFKAEAIQGNVQAQFNLAGAASALAAIEDACYTP